MVGGSRGKQVAPDVSIEKWVTPQAGRTGCPQKSREWAALKSESRATAQQSGEAPWRGVW